jgi:hypothetical protein
LAIDARNHRDVVEDQGLGEHKDVVAVDRVKGPGDVTGDLEVLFLVLAHRHEIALDDQNVGRHQHRVGEEAVVGYHALRHLFLEGVAALKETHGGHGREVPGQLGDLGKIRLSPSQGRARDP